MSTPQIPSKPVAPEQALKDLEARLKTIPRAARPLEYAALRYSIGMAYAELPSGDRRMNFSRALAAYEDAAQIFNPVRFPVEHARVQNARGAALRELGDNHAAIQALERAVELLAAGRAPAELGAALNNLGLARSALGQHEEAVKVLQDAVDVFAVSAETARQRTTAMHNLAQAHAAAGNHAAAAEVCRSAIAGIDLDESPFQWALLQHALGVSLTAIAQPREAAQAFSAALRVFSRQRYPFQHALAKNNLGLACAQIGDVLSLRRAVASFEDALGLLDVRLHRPQWEQAFRNLELAESALRDAGITGSRAENFVALAAALPQEERMQLVRERLTVVLALPDPRRIEALAELDIAMLRLPDEGTKAVTAAWLQILMELPNDHVLAGLRARLAAHQHLGSEEAHERADVILEHTIMNELLAPQRIRVRDTLISMGYERR